MTKRLLGLVAVVTLAGLPACGGHSNSPTPPLAPAGSKTLASDSSSPACSTASVQSLQVTQTSLTLTSAAPQATFTACTQYETDYTISVSPAGIISAPQSVTATNSGITGIKSAAIQVTAIASGNATITITDKTGDSAQVSVTVQLLPKGTIFASNYWSPNQVVEYAPDASGYATPVTQLTDPRAAGQLALDSAGNLYAGFHDTLAVFPSSATGAAPPSSSITGPDTGLSEIRGVVVDSSGNIWVANMNGNSVTEYAPGSNGDAVPVRTIQGGNTELYQPAGIALDASGNIFVSSSGWASSGAVFEYAANANGNATPINSYQFIYQPQSVSVDANENLYVSTAGGLFKYPYTGVNQCTGATGVPCGTAWGVGTMVSNGNGTFDSAGDLVVTSIWENQIWVYPPNSTTTSRVINTAIGPWGVAAY